MLLVVYSKVILQPPVAGPIILYETDPSPLASAINVAGVQAAKALLKQSCEPQLTVVFTSVVMLTPVVAPTVTPPAVVLVVVPVPEAVTCWVAVKGVEEVAAETGDVEVATTAGVEAGCAKNA